jgi:methylenetetrahydrofolate--tRNA-(uracil-5-)-methyltransferase
LAEVIVVGAGLAGCEAAYQLARRGIDVQLVEMKPGRKTPAHSENTFAELVCSNSLKAESLTSGAGLLKAEMRAVGSLLLEAADAARVPAGASLAVDRQKFSAYVDAKIRANPRIEVIEREMDVLPEGPCIVATGPLSSDAVIGPIQAFLQEDSCYFYDAEAPIVTRESIDMSKAYAKSRYDKGSPDFLNCPLNEQEFEAFYQAVLTAETVPLHAFEKEVYYEGCMPFEVMARRGRNTLLFGPMKPVGLRRPDGSRPYAVVQLRQDNVEASLYNVVGFQTHLTWGAQKRILHMIPGLEEAEIVRYGVMHRNTYINAPKCLRETYQSIKRENLFFAGQITGVEGYMESGSSGMLAGINMAHLLRHEPLTVLGNETMMGALAHYITHADPAHFQPMGANFGIMHLKTPVHGKKERKDALARQSLARIEELVKGHDL